MPLWQAEIIARKLIVEHKPEVIVAVACHRDLVEGTRMPDVARLCCLERRPHGPASRPASAWQTWNMPQNSSKRSAK